MALQKLFYLIKCNSKVHFKFQFMDIKLLGFFIFIVDCV